MIVRLAAVAIVLSLVGGPVGAILCGLSCEEHAATVGGHHHHTAAASVNDGSGAALRSDSSSCTHDATAVPATMTTSKTSPALVAVHQDLARTLAFPATSVGSQPGVGRPPGRLSSSALGSPILRI